MPFALKQAWQEIRRFWKGFRPDLLVRTCIFVGFTFEYYRVRHVFRSEIADSDFKIADCSFMKEQEMLQQSATFLFAAGIISNFLPSNKTRPLVADGHTAVARSFIFGFVLLHLLLVVLCTYLTRTGMFLMWNIVRDCIKQYTKQSPLIRPVVESDSGLVLGWQRETNWLDFYNGLEPGWRSAVDKALQAYMPHSQVGPDGKHPERGGTPEGAAIVCAISQNNKEWASFRASVVSQVCYKFMKQHIAMVVSIISFMAMLDKFVFGIGLIAWLVGILLAWYVPSGIGALGGVLIAPGILVVLVWVCSSVGVWGAARQAYDCYHTKESGCCRRSEPAPDFSGWDLTKDLDDPPQERSRDEGHVACNPHILMAKNVPLRVRGCQNKRFNCARPATGDGTAADDTRHIADGSGGGPGDPKDTILHIDQQRFKAFSGASCGCCRNNPLKSNRRGLTALPGPSAATTQPMTHTDEGGRDVEMIELGNSDIVMTREQRLEHGGSAEPSVVTEASSTSAHVRPLLKFSNLLSRTRAKGYSSSTSEAEDGHEGLQ